MVLSASVILYLIGITLPQVSDMSHEKAKRPRASWMMDFIEQVDEKLDSLIQKTLRRVKVITMRLDNSVSKRLKRNGNGENSKSLTS